MSGPGDEAELVLADLDVALREAGGGEAVGDGVLVEGDEGVVLVRVADEVDVCSAVGLSERTLRRRALASIGMTWQAYVAQSRLLRAATLLAEGDGSVLEAASAVGYESQGSFGRAFRRWMGESPSAYRERMRAHEVRA